MLTFYYAPDTCALASHIALEHVGAEYETVRVDFARNEQRSTNYLRVNPKGRVPALKTSRGILTETPAILLFISQTYPHAQLAPLDDPFELAQQVARRLPSVVRIFRETRRDDAIEARTVASLPAILMSESTFTKR